MMTAIVAPTPTPRPQALLADYRRYADPEGALTLMSGWTGVDFSKLDPDQVVEHVENEAGRTALENITRADPNRRWTVREVAEHVSIGGIGPVVVGSPQPSPTSSRILDRRHRPRRLQPGLRGPARDLRQTWSICSCPNCSAAAATSAPTRPDRCERSSSATRASVNLPILGHAARLAAGGLLQ